MEFSIIGVIDLIGTLFFLLALTYALKNFRNTRELSDYWMIFGAAMGLGALWAFLTALEWFSIYPQILDEVQPLIAVATATSLSIAAIVLIFSSIKPFDE